MAEALRESTMVEEEYFVEPPNIDHLITEDDEPVDNMFSEKQQRLLTDSLYASWKPGRPFLTTANVGVFYSIHQPAIVPDALISLDVEVADDLWAKHHRSYFTWEFGKPPEVVVEIVSNTRGGETDKKFKIYAGIGVWYYVILDPQKVVQNNMLRTYELSTGKYIPRLDHSLERIGLKTKLWDGVFEGKREQWLRWYDLEDTMLLTGIERAEQERQRVAQEQQRADQEQQRADQEQQRAERLVAQLRALGVEPAE